MKEGGDGFVRADQIDLKNLDEQLERHLSRAWTMEKKKEEERGGGRGERQREDWEIDPSKLVIKGAIARGTFAAVHRGVYDGQDVAVKLLDWGEEGNRTEAETAQLRAAFSQEVSVWHKLDHPNVTKFIGATMGGRDLSIQTENGHLGIPSNVCCVVVEYLPGGALKTFLIKNRRRKLAFKVVIQMALDLARGLSYLHSKKIVHRDVKTENMLLDKSRTVKIADFGVARVEAQNPHDMTGETGTLGYMAPEVLNGSPYNRKCDVYSFGICLWEIYCCDMPYPDLSFSEVTSAVVRQNLRPEIPRCCPSSLANIMKRCWDANPDRRPEMDGVVAMLEAIDTSKGGGMIPLDQPQGLKLLDWGEEGNRTEAETAQLRAAFSQEVSVWHKLDHPNVTKFIGATMGGRDLSIQTENGHLGIPSNVCCVVVEYLPGGALKTFLIKNRRRKLAFKVVIQMALDLARGLSYLHSKKIVHRDVKTENMLLDKSRTVKIADFGVARVEAQNPHDMTGETGTLGYMAPEVLNGSPYNRKCDVYSFGICLWEIYCCDMPYPDLSFSEVTSAVVRQNLRPEIPRCCPSSLANIMKRCWDANPDRRPEMDGVVAMLEAIDTSKGGGMIPLDQPQGCLPCFRKNRGP
ncbi:putative Serine/threonine-protein kinase HT1 [Cocos nucifera]|nr:putative Serine/threonine-protein kinase HT1 [Cocos nucifera]